MESSNPEGVALPPPPAIIPPNVVPIVSEEKRLELMKKASNPKRVPMARPGIGSKGQRIPLLTNHFKVGVNKSDGYFFHYSIDMLYEDGTPVGEKGIGRKVLDKVKETYGSELGHKEFAYDGEKSLFTVGSLPRNRLDFVIVLDDISSIRRTGSAGGSSNPTDSAGDRKRVKKQYQSKTLKVQVNFATKIPMQAIVNALRGQDSEHFQEAVRVLDIVLRQNAAKQGCLLVRQSFFHNNQSFKTLGGGVQSCSGFHSSFRATQGGLSLNMDVSTTMIVKPGSVLDFLLENQNVKNNDQIDWIKAKRMLKNLRITAHPSNMEYRITGLSEKPCKEQRFFLKTKNGQDGDGEEITVFDYFAVYKNLPVRKSADFPCINVGKPKRPSYFPVEFCDLVSLQRYTKALSSTQRALLVEQSRKSPQEQMTVLRNVLKTSKYNADLMLRSSGISIGAEFVQVEGRVLSAPKLQVGNGQEFFPRNGRWNFNNKTLVEPVKIGRWAIVNFSARCDIRYLVNSMLKCAEMKGITIEDPLFVFEENYQNRRYPAHVRVEKMFDDISSEPEPRLLLCILPERKNSDIYGPWKRRNLSELGIVTQCIAPTKLNDQYITNVLLKINAKLGGMNSLLTVEHSPSIHLVSKCPTLILGMDVSHGSPGRSDVPSIAAVVSSRNWPSISHYRAAVRTQSPRVEMIASLFKPVSDKVDEGIIRELLHDFYSSSKGRKPDQIIIFRDGVSESQFNQVLNVELDQIIQACKFLDESWSPKFMVIVAQKNHHTKFFQTRSPENVPPGTIIDNKVRHPKNNDFYLCAHAGMIGTTRPAHYHVLYDELGFSADNVQELVHSLSYVYQRSTTAVSVVAPICYAHLAAAQISQFIKFDDMSETSSSHAGGVAVPELPRLAPNVINSMYFC
ncbi:unnamed protein product [Prunus armeniaca]|uniref:Argonaute 4 n=1 Tax=Prunus armeniaca TaxID=36596 RepID=A0A6J5WI14_PRUAR|nr:unnamed protein product [Prunus armeniaca]CAB4299004.1 unnamed protein product [Prunus armeniaca]